MLGRDLERARPRYIQLTRRSLIYVMAPLSKKYDHKFDGGSSVQTDCPRKRMIRIKINGHWREDAVAENQLLVDYLRDDVGLTGVKIGCDGGECGACTVLLDNEAIPSCLTLAVRCEGRVIGTVEGLARQGRPDRLQRAFHERLGTQCGFCTPGMIMASEALLRRNPHPSESEIRAALSGNLCRCTGYIKIVESVRAATETEQ
jgi:4-hydroxybenzoyl-CoA reductase subunit gamma